jgi:hypothetical protein
MIKITSIKSYITNITRWLTREDLFDRRIQHQNKLHNEKNDSHNKSAISRSKNKVDDKNSSRYYASYLFNRDISSHL